MQKILIVEDHLRLAALMKKGLCKHGFTTAVAKDGEEAMQQFQQDQFDLILLDINLPGMDGWAVAREIRQQGGQLPILVVSARSDIPETIARGNDAVDGYIIKPFKFSYLLAQVQELLKPS
ncbi:MAG: response regulator [Leptolyngbyaceae cyanobacterium MO_188.B28]|nr:response regulator [Leptolyngbyaceae cyanobacterium MO_188.B28]